MANETTKTLRKGGPEKCPGGACSECIGGPHHFSDAMTEDEVTMPGHEAIAMGVDVWYQCKHCDGWQEYDLDAELDDVESSSAAAETTDNGTLLLNFGEAYGIARQIDLETTDPRVCPGCHAVDEPCKPGCIDAEIEADNSQRDDAPISEGPWVSWKN